MSAQEYGLWMAHFGDEPWGEDRMDVGFGVLASTLANINRKKDATPYAITDFAPYLKRHSPKEKEPEMSPMQFIQSLEAQRRG